MNTLSKTEKILVFEPWHLGDLIISVYFAKVLHLKFGMKFDFICKPAWQEWLNNQSFIANTATYHAPWTDKRGKYLPHKYNPIAIYKLRKKILLNTVDFTWDVRGDLRHKLFLSLLSANNVISMRYTNSGSVYNRINNLLFYFGEDKIDHPRFTPAKIKNIFLFLDAAWVNRQIPTSKAFEILDQLVTANHSIYLATPPETNYSEYKERYAEKITLCNGSISELTKILSAMDICISTDSAWLHMAYYSGIPTIGLFGSLNADEWAPPGTTVIYSEKPLTADERYKLKNEYTTPLAFLDTKKVLSALNQLKGLV